MVYGCSSADRERSVSLLAGVTAEAQQQRSLITALLARLARFEGTVTAGSIGKTEAGAAATVTASGSAGDNDAVASHPQAAASGTSELQSPDHLEDISVPLHHPLAPAAPKPAPIPRPLASTSTSSSNASAIIAPTRPNDADDRLTRALEALAAVRQERDDLALLLHDMQAALRGAAMPSD